MLPTFATIVARSFATIRTLVHIASILRITTSLYVAPLGQSLYGTSATEIAQKYICCRFGRTSIGISAFCPTV